MATRHPRIAAPSIPQPDLADLLAADPGTITAGGEYAGHRYAPCDLSARDLSGASFSECEFVDLRLDQAQLRGVRLAETGIERAGAPLCRAARTSWRAVQVRHTRFGAFELSEAELCGVCFTASRFDFVNLRHARLRDVLFRDCLIDELEFGAARAERLAFQDCTIRNLVLDHARLDQVDLRGLVFDTISGLDAVRGTILTSHQAGRLAVQLAEHLGITIVPPPGGEVAP